MMEAVAQAFTALVAAFGWPTLAFLAFMTLVTSAVHGATGVAGGFLMAAVLANFIGAKATVPVMSVALLASHSSRAILNVGAIDARAFRIVALSAVPMIAIVAYGYGRLSSPAVAGILGVILTCAVFMRRYARRRAITAGPKLLATAGAGYGILSGASIGPGLFLSPFLLGFGLGREAFVATLACVAVLANLTRTVVFGSTDLLSVQWVVLGVLIGLFTIPGNWVGRTVLRAMSDARHASVVDLFCLVGAANFFWLAVAGG